ncbi:ompA family protein [Collimonas pratensis]|uniref:OmpA family protein n=2 Tax=Collimonas pratensis TaxID=279113 RepID=A0A127Q3M5_9BURK|nr:ompA family protein [Collimonas pratensis]
MAIILPIYNIGILSISPVFPEQIRLLSLVMISACQNMSPKFKLALGLTLCLSIPLLGCKRNSETPQPQAAAAVSAAPAPALAAAAASKPTKAVFDIDSIPLSSVVLPPFPYLDWPQGLADGDRFSDKSAFDRAYVIAGDQLQAVEGRIESRRFRNSDAQLSQLAAQRNYESAIKALGGVKVNTALPSDPILVAANGGDVGDIVVNKLGLKDYVNAYDVYLIRTPERNVWIAVTSSSTSTQITAIEEQAMKQQVAFVTADAMQSALNAQGHVALYINFDNDKAQLKPDGLNAVDEIAKLLKQDAALKLAIEGHTDNSGDAQHNKALSQQRADAVMTTLLTKGIDKGRLSASGRGADQPVADNGSDQGRAKNRRVELVKQS